MTVYIVETCVCDEYGCMSAAAVLSSEDAAHKWAKEHGYQNEDFGGPWNHPWDFYRVKSFEVDPQD